LVLLEILGLQIDLNFVPTILDFGIARCAGRNVGGKVEIFFRQKPRENMIFESLILDSPLKKAALCNRPSGRRGGA